MWEGMGNAVQDWLDALPDETRRGVDRLRAIVRAAGPDLDESIKWNAPNFSDLGRDRVTLGLDRKGGYRLVLHRGATASARSGFAFDDPETIARWPAPDRGVASFADIEAVERRAMLLEDLVRRWLQATRETEGDS